MNPRIRELAEQCWSHRVDGALVDGQLHFDQQKFAQLIIQECIDYCGENLSKTVGGALKIHFGVEQ